MISALLLGWLAAAVDPSLVGRWRTQTDGGIVEISRCGDALCGRVIDGDPLRRNPDQRDVHNPDPALRDRPVRGIAVIKGFTGGPTKWRGGSVYDPVTGQRASNGSLVLTDAGQLIVTGCVALLLCRSQTWTRLR